MERHGSESYFVVGEGLLGERRRREGRGSRAVLRPPPPRSRRRSASRGWGQRRERQLGVPNLKKVGEVMASGGGGRRPIPAGFTYLGQFVDHDLTFDKTEVCSARTSRPRSSCRPVAEPRPRLAVRRRAERPRLREVLRGRRAPPQDRRRPSPSAASPPKPGHDLPRGAGATRGQKRTAIIPDPRNDENLAVAQHAPRVHPLPEPRRRHASGVGPARPAVREGAPESRHALPVDAQDRLPPRICAPASSTTSSTKAARPSRSACRPSTCRRCRSSSPWPRSGSVTR